MSRTRPLGRALVTGVAVTLALGLSVPTANARPADFGVGAPGVGDPYFPQAGNGGIDVLSYDLDLTYQPPPPAPAPREGELTGTATIRLRMTDDLRRFNLDLRGLTASRVTVDGDRARHRQVGGELRITPDRPVRRRHKVTVVVEYGGTTTRPRDIENALYGWVTTRDGAMVASEPDGSSTWYPVNDHPTDKARYSFDIAVPDGLVAVANGLLEGSVTEDGWTTWSWDAPDPMASYLATASVGNYVLDRYTTRTGTPIIDAVDADLPDSASEDLALTGAMLRFFEKRYGRYPFNSYGAIVDDDSVGYALETQTRSIFSGGAGEGTIAHELAHQWMGNHVSPSRWADIWLNEGWATYSTWLWSQHTGDRTADEAFAREMSRPADDDYWELVVADPGPLGLFAGPVYNRGAATLHALRDKIGSRDFFRLARAWNRRYGDDTASTRDFIRLAEKVSHRRLRHFFRVWVYTPEKPTDW